MRSGFGETEDFHITETAILSLRIFNNILCDLVVICALEWASGFGIHKGLAFDRDRNL